MSTMFRDPFPIEKYENDNTYGNQESEFKRYFGKLNWYKSTGMWSEKKIRLEDLLIHTPYKANGNCAGNLSQYSSKF